MASHNSPLKRKNQRQNSINKPQSESSSNKDLVEALKTKVKHLSYLSDYLHDLIIITNLKGRILFYSKSSEFLKDNLNNLSGKNIMDCVTPEDKDKVYNAFGGCKPFRECPQVEFRFQCMDDSYKWVEASSIIIAERDSRLERLVFRIKNINKQKQLEKEVESLRIEDVKSERLITSFLSNLSHEIRTPMNGIMGFTEMLEAPNISAESKIKYIEIIKRCGNRLAQTIDQLIDISTIDANTSKVNSSSVNVNTFIDEQFEYFVSRAFEKGVELKFNKGLAGDYALVETDYEKLSVILKNLINNAIKFTDKGKVEFGYNRIGEALRFYVIDTGIGISPEQKPLVFKKFSHGDEKLSSNYEGIGLGLSIAKGYVDLLGGDIWMDSTLGQGSTFYFTIPYQPSKTDDDLQGVIKDINLPSTQREKLNVLIVDDEKVSVLLLNSYLEGSCNEIYSVKNGLEAVDFLKNNNNIDLVLMDVRMPVMNGLEATRQIRQFNQDVIIFMQTAHTTPQYIDDALIVGSNEVITKPIKKRQLTSLIKKYLDLGFFKK